MELGSVQTDPAGKATVERTPPKRQPTVQDLLRHTAGFAYGGIRRDHELIKLWPAGSVDSAFTYTGPEFLEKLSQLPFSTSRERCGTTASRSTCEGSSSRL